MPMVHLRDRRRGGPALTICLMLASTYAHSATSSNPPAVNPTNSPGAVDASEMARSVITTADLSIKASDRALSVMMWMLGVCLGGSAIGVGVIWAWLSSFTRKMKG